jgi:starvation-inducible DNA-binding protein
MVIATEARVIAALKHAEANALTLYLNNKRYHWFTFGPLFRDLHLFFDEMANAAFGEVDPLAERLRMLRADPVSTPEEIEAWATVTVAKGKPTPRAMLEEALANEMKVVDEMRVAAKVADDENDPGTNDLFATLVQTHEKHAWFIDEFLRRGDGMAS